MHMLIEVNKGTHDVTVPKREKIVYRSSSCKMIEVANLHIKKDCYKRWGKLTISFRTSEIISNLITTVSEENLNIRGSGMCAELRAKQDEKNKMMI